jgi:hypothetical protein
VRTVATNTRTKPPKPEKPLDGRDYVAKYRISDNDNATLADVGDTCENVPQAALRVYVQQGYIERKGKARDEGEAT